MQLSSFMQNQLMQSQAYFIDFIIVNEFKRMFSSSASPPRPRPRLAVSRAFRESGQVFASCIVVQYGGEAKAFG